MDRLSGLVTRHPGGWIKLGNLETWLTAGVVDPRPVERPIYIAGLARSGSTILLETLARHPEVATHRYRDFPFLFTPYLWNRWLDLMPRPNERPAERSHADGITVTSESPEAFEEVLWMAFFPYLHDPSRSNVLDRSTRNAAFEHFYRDHQRKLLAARRRTRYVAKGNYNVSRLGYLLRLFPKARIIVPVRDPVWHIASLMKQHALFLRGQDGNPKAARHLRRVGHYEFGQDRRPMNLGDPAATEEITALWRSGEELRGWARYWAQVHHFIADALRHDPALRQAVRVVRYEGLCAEPRANIAGLLAHCGLKAEPAFLDAAARRFHLPGYYRPAFNDRELALIADETGAAAARFTESAERSVA
ncbi:MAG TPA: sulfotransferase [Dongiaceae bacterium]|nr:sulfotransferase [Dongiaceae bacterium]